MLSRATRTTRAVKDCIVALRCECFWRVEWVARLVNTHDRFELKYVYATGESTRGVYSVRPP